MKNAYFTLSTNNRARSIQRRLVYRNVVTVIGLFPTGWKTLAKIGCPFGCARFINMQSCSVIRDAKFRILVPRSLHLIHSPVMFLLFEEPLCDKFYFYSTYHCYLTVVQIPCSFVIVSCKYTYSIKCWSSVLNICEIVATGHSTRRNQYINRCDKWLEMEPHLIRNRNV